MGIFGEAFVAIRSFFEAGGPVLYGILAVTILMWTFIIERFWYFAQVMPSELVRVRDEWEGRADTTSWYAHRVRDMLISEVNVGARRYLGVIEVMMQILPLLGLLGTVWGMIQVFDVMTVFGTGNARLMAGGVSQATIPTMAGLVAALSGLYISSYLRQRADREIERVGDALVHH